MDELVVYGGGLEIARTMPVSPLPASISDKNLQFLHYGIKRQLRVDRHMALGGELLLCVYLCLCSVQFSSVVPWMRLPLDAAMPR